MTQSMAWIRIAAVAIASAGLLTACGGGGGGGSADGKSWQGPELRESGTPGDVGTPSIGFDAGGNAVMVWKQDDGIWANRYTANVGWGTAVRIESNNAGNVSGHSVAVDQNGNAVAVWSQNDGMRGNIWSNRYTANVGWGTALLIESSSTEDAGFPSIGVDASGNAVAVWRQFYEDDGALHVNTWSNRYVANVGWGTAVLIGIDNPGCPPLSDPSSLRWESLAVDASGNAFAAWIQCDGTRYSILSNRYAANVGWVTAVPIDATDAGDAFSPSIAADASGNAIAVWLQFDGAGFNIWSNRYTANVGWAAAAPIVDDAGPLRDPSVAMDPDGNAVVVWTRQDNTRINIWSSRYAANDGWGTPLRIDNNAGAAHEPAVATDASGNALAVWYQHDGTRHNIWSNRYAAEAGWSQAVLLESSNRDARDVAIAMDSSGDAFAVWSQYEGTASAYRLYSARFE